jgi:hypothetical protein
MIKNDKRKRKGCQGNRVSREIRIDSVRRGAYSIERKEEVRGFRPLQLVTDGVKGV